MKKPQLIQKYFYQGRYSYPLKKPRLLSGINAEAEKAKEIIAKAQEQKTIIEKSKESEQLKKQAYEKLIEGLEKAKTRAIWNTRA